MSKILISYRREDSADVTGRIYDRLIQAFPKAVFRDVDSMPPGIDFRHHLDEQVAKCDVFLAVIGRNWMKLKSRTGKSRLEDPRDFVRIEIESALKRRIPVIPVLVSGAVIPPVDRLPVSLQDLSYRHSVVVRSDPDFHRDMDRLIEHLRVQIEGQQAHVRPPEAQHTVSEPIATAEAACSVVKGTGQENVEIAVAPSSSEPQPEVMQPQEEAPVVFTDAHSIVRDGNATVEEVRSKCARLEEDRVEETVPSSELDTPKRVLEAVEEEPATPTSASRVTAGQSQSYMFGLIVLILVIGAVVWFLVIQPEKKHVIMNNTPIPSPEMIRISPDSFLMGSNSASEAPIHKVTFTKPFAIARYETTFEEYDHFAQATKRILPPDRGTGRGRRPVINISQDDAEDYAKWLSQQTGKRYRLPTEAEWEYAARSGGKNEIWAGTSNESDLAAYAVFSSGGIEEVGSRKPNGLGLYDMSGNVFERVQDCWIGNYRDAPTDGSAWGRCRHGSAVLRGGSWFHAADSLRTTYRWTYEVYPYTAPFIGFRLAQDLEP